jgi:hypothetical protein
MAKEEKDWYGFYATVNVMRLLYIVHILHKAVAYIAGTAEIMQHLRIKLKNAPTCR